MRVYFLICCHRLQDWLKLKEFNSISIWGDIRRLMFDSICGNITLRIFTFSWSEWIIFHPDPTGFFLASTLTRLNTIFTFHHLKAYFLPNNKLPYLPSRRSSSSTINRYYIQTFPYHHFHKNFPHSYINKFIVWACSTHPSIHPHTSTLFRAYIIATSIQKCQ